MYFADTTGLNSPQDLEGEKMADRISAQALNFNFLVFLWASFKWEKKNFSRWLRAGSGAWIFHFFKMKFGLGVSWSTGTITLVKMKAGEVGKHIFIPDLYTAMFFEEKWLETAHLWVFSSRKWLEISVVSHGGPGYVRWSTLRRKKKLLQVFERTQTPPNLFFFSESRAGVAFTSRNFPSHYFPFFPFPFFSMGKK